MARMHQETGCVKTRCSFKCRSGGCRQQPGKLVADTTSLRSATNAHPTLCSSPMVYFEIVKLKAT